MITHVNVVVKRLGDGAERNRAARPGVRRRLTPPGSSVHDKCMAVKTITIDMAAYDALSRRKRPGQSFSDVIKAHFGAGGTGADLLEALGRHRIAPQTVERVAVEVSDRRRSRARPPKL